MKAIADFMTDLVNKEYANGDINGNSQMFTIGVPIPKRESMAESIYTGFLNKVFLFKLKKNEFSI